MKQILFGITILIAVFLGNYLMGRIQSVKSNKES